MSPDRGRQDVHRDVGAPCPLCYLCPNPRQLVQVCPGGPSSLQCQVRRQGLWQGLRAQKARTGQQLCPGASLSSKGPCALGTSWREDEGTALRGSRQFSLPEEFHRNSWCERPSGSISKGCQHQGWIGWGAAEGGYPGRAPPRAVPHIRHFMGPQAGTHLGTCVDSWVSLHQWCWWPQAIPKTGSFLFPCQANAHTYAQQRACQPGAGHGMLCTLWPP